MNLNILNDYLRGFNAAGLIGKEQALEISGHMNQGKKPSAWPIILSRICFMIVQMAFFLFYYQKTQSSTVLLAINIIVVLTVLYGIIREDKYIFNFGLIILFVQFYILLKFYNEEYGQINIDSSLFQGVILFAAVYTLRYLWKKDFFKTSRQIRFKILNDYLSVWQKENLLNKIQSDKIADYIKAEYIREISILTKIMCFLGALGILYGLTGTLTSFFQGTVCILGFLVFCLPGALIAKKASIKNRAEFSPNNWPIKENIFFSAGNVFFLFALLFFARFYSEHIRQYTAGVGYNIPLLGFFTLFLTSILFIIIAYPLKDQFALILGISYLRFSASASALGYFPAAGMSVFYQTLCVLIIIFGIWHLKLWNNKKMQDIIENYYLLPFGKTYIYTGSFFMLVFPLFFMAYLMLPVLCIAIILLPLFLKRLDSP